MCKMFNTSERANAPYMRWIVLLPDAELQLEHRRASDLPRIPSVIAVVAIASHPVPGTSLDRAVADYDLAQQKGDGPALRRLLADDYLLVNSGGAVETKAEYIADLTAPDFRMEPFEVLRLVSRPWSGGAVRGVVALLSGTSGGHAFSGCLRFVDVWRLAGGKWQVAYSQAAKEDAAACRPLSS